MTQRLPYRRLIAGLLAMAVSGSAAAAQLSPGPYLSLFGGYSDTDVTLRTADGERLRFSPAGSLFGAGAGMLAPWGHAAIGLEGNFAIDRSRTSRDVEFTAEEGDSAEPARLTLEGDYSYGVALLLGGFVQQALVYGRAGVQWLRLESDIRPESGEGNVRGSDTFNGFRAGIGTAIPVINDRLSLRLDYSRTFYREKNDVEPEQDLFTIGIALVF